MQETVSLTIADLKKIDKQHLKDLSPEVCLQVCKDDDKKYEYGTEILQLWTQKLLAVYDSHIMSRVFLRDLVTLLEKVFLQMVPDEIHDNTNKLEALQAWVEECYDFISAHLDSVATANIRILLYLGLVTCVQTINFCFKWWQAVNLRVLLNRTVLLTHLSLDILNKQLDGNFNLDNEEERNDLYKLNDTLCLMAVFSNPVELKTILAVWKCLARMVTMSSQFSIHKEFAKRPIETFLGKIGYWLHLIYTEQLINPHHICSILQTSKFLLRLLKCMTIDFRNNDYPLTEYFFSIYLLAFNLPKALKKINIKPLAITCVQEGFKELVKLLYNHDDFNELLLIALSKNVPVDVCHDYLDVCVNLGDAEFLQRKTNIQMHMFEFIFTNVDILLDENVYSQFLEYFSVLAIINRGFCQFLQHNVSFEKNFLILQASAETLLIRVNTIDFEDLLSEFRYWRDHNDRFVVCSIQINGIYVKHLLQHCTKLCAGKVKHDLSVLDLNHNLSMRVYRYYISILDAYPRTSHGQNELIEETNDFLENVFVPNTIAHEQYYKMSLNLHIFNNVLCSHPSDLVDSVQYILSELLQNKQRLLAFESAAFKYLSKHMHIVVKSSYRELVLNELQSQVPKNVSPNVAMVNFVLVSAQEGDLEMKKISQILLKIFEKIHWCATLITPYTREYEDNYEMNKVTLSPLLRKATLHMIAHQCEKSVSSDDISHLHKRARLENILESDSFESMLSEMLQNSTALLNTTKKQKVDWKHKYMVKDIIKNLEQISNSVDDK